MLRLAERRRHGTPEKCAPHQGVVDGARYQAPQPQPTELLGAPQSAGGEVVHARHQGAEVLAEQCVGDDPQGGLHHRLVHVERRLLFDRRRHALDRLDHQVDELIEIAPRERGIQGGPMRGPRVAFIGQQVDACRGTGGLVVVGLDVFQPGPVQYVVDVVGVGSRDETSSSAAKSGDIVAARPAEEAVADLLARTRIGPADLDDPEAVVAASDEIVAVRRLLAVLPDAAGLGIDVGSRFRLTHLGLFGFAAMSCATFRELFGIAMRYFSLTMLNIDVKLFEGAESCLLEFEVDHLPADVRGFFLERDVAAIVMTVSEFALPVVERYAGQMTVEATLDQEVVAPLLEPLPVVPREFGRVHNRVHFPRAMFDEPLPQADSHTQQMCIA